MAKPESLLWDSMSKGISGRWEAQRIEDKYSLGVPDVFFSYGGCHGMIELKAIPTKRKDNNQILRIAHFTTEQRNWLRRHGPLGGHCFLFLQYGDDYLLFNCSNVKTVDAIGGVSVNEHYAMASTVWVNKIDWKEFLQALLPLIT